jgi:hypothetical protein
VPRGLQSVEYTEFTGQHGESPQEWFDMDANGGTRVLDVPWDQRATAVAELLGYSYIDTSGGEGNWVLRRWLPDYMPSFPVMIAKSCRVRGIGLAEPPGGQQYVEINGRREAVYAKARLTVSYGMPDFVVAEDNEVSNETQRFVTPMLRPSAEYLTPANVNWLQFSEGPAGLVNQRFPGQVGVPVYTADYHLLWRAVPFDGLPHFTQMELLGKVNKTNFEIPGVPDAFTPHQLLLIGVDLTLTNSPFQARTWNINYGIQARPKKHTSLLATRSDPAFFGFLQASVDGVLYTPGMVPDGKLLFDEREFLDLFDINDPSAP